MRILLFVVVWVLLWFVPVDAVSQTVALRKAIESIVGDREIGVAVRFSDDECLVNDHAQYQMASVVKLFQAVMVLDSLERAGLYLDVEISIEKDDIKPNTWSPMREKYAKGSVITLCKLLEYSLQQSDNNACDILFKHFGEPKRLDSFIRGLGLKRFGIAATEDNMHRDFARNADNWTCPSTATKLVELIYGGKLLKKSYNDFLMHTLEGCTTGTDRLAAPLICKEVVIGHKTGTRPNNADDSITAINDVGYVKLPDGRHYAIAVFVKNSKDSLEKTSALVAEISRTVHESFNRKTL